MTFIDKLSKELNDKLKESQSNLLEAVGELAGETRLTESEGAVVMSAVAKYVDGAVASIVGELVEYTDSKVTAYANLLEAEATDKEKEAEEEVEKIKEEAEKYGEYVKEEAEEKIKEKEEELEEAAEKYVKEEVIPHLEETVDSYLAIMAAKLITEGKEAGNVFKAKQFDRITESLAGIGMVTTLTESEQEKIVELEKEKDEIEKELKELKKKYNESKREDVVNEKTVGLSEQQRERVARLASRLDAGSDDFESTVSEIVESIKSTKVNKGNPVALNENAGEGNKSDGGLMDRYASFARASKNTRLN